MPYELKWFVPEKIVLVKFGQVLMDTELFEYDKEVCVMLDMGAPKQVHLLLDVAELQEFPNLGQAIQLKMGRHPNIGLTMFIGNKKPIIRTMSILIARLFGTQIQWCDTLEEALTSLKRTDTQPS